VNCQLHRIIYFFLTAIPHRTKCLHCTVRRTAKASNFELDVKFGLFSSSEGLATIETRHTEKFKKK
jgi:hypothetical protein